MIQTTINKAQVTFLFYKIRMAECEDDLGDCPVCFEEYKNYGGSIPRLLPCSHTFCHACMTELLQDNSLECPECRTKHHAESGLRSFPQNKYILSHMRKISAVAKKEFKFEYKFQSCKEHGKELSLFCKTDGCKKAICQLCMIKKHKTHDVTDIDEDRKVQLEALVTCIESFAKDLQTSKKNMEAAKQKLKTEHNTCASLLKKAKDEQLKALCTKFDNIIRDDSNQTTKICRIIDDDVAIIDENLALLKSIEENTCEESSHDDVEGKLELLQNIMTQMKTNLSVK